MTAHKVLRPAWSSDAYRSAVATIIRDIQRASGATLVDIAESIDVSLGTISNAVNEKTGLTAEYLARLGSVYGGSFLNPYFQLFGGQFEAAAPKASRDILPLALRVSQKIAAARDPDGPGGTTELPQEKSAYLGDLKELHRETGNLVTEIEEVLS